MWTCTSLQLWLCACVCVCVCVCVCGPEPSHFSLSASWLSRHALCLIQPTALCLSLSSHSLSLSLSLSHPFPPPSPFSLCPPISPSVQGIQGPRGPPGEIGRDGPKVCALNVIISYYANGLPLPSRSAILILFKCCTLPPRSLDVPIEKSAFCWRGVRLVWSQIVGVSEYVINVILLGTVSVSVYLFWDENAKVRFCNILPEMRLQTDGVFWGFVNCNVEALARDKLKDKFTQKWRSRHHFLPLTLMESQVKCRAPQNICHKTSQQNNVGSVLLNNWSSWGLVLKLAPYKSHVMRRHERIFWYIHGWTYRLTDKIKVALKYYDTLTLAPRTLQKMTADKVWALFLLCKDYHKGQEGVFRFLETWPWNAHSLSLWNLYTEHSAKMEGEPGEEIKFHTYEGEDWLFENEEPACFQQNGSW